MLRDRETGSLWSQITGTCIQGPMSGQSLTLYPSFQTTFSEFQKLYPEGLVLKKPEKGPSGSTYDNYMSDPDKLGIFGRINDFQRLPAKSHVYGLRFGDRAVAISRNTLESQKLVILSNVSPPVAVTYDPETQTAAAFALDSTLVGSPKDVTVDGSALSVKGDSTVWNARTGHLEEGTGRDLEPVPLLTSYWFAWISFFPETELIK